MVPKNKLQELILSYSKVIRDKVSSSQLDFGFDKCFKKKGVINRKDIVTCLECGNESNRRSGYLSVVVTGHFCEKCTSLLEVKATRKRTFKEYSFYTIIDFYKGHQVVRNFELCKVMKKGQCSEFSIKEVYQLWFSPDLQITTVGFWSASRYYDIWSGDWEIRDYRYAATDYLATGKVVYSKTIIIPALRKIGVNLRNICCKNPSSLLVDVIGNSSIETLLKAKRTDVVKSLDMAKIKAYWPSIKLLIKYKYKPKSITFWFDYLKMLESEGKDLRNSSVVLPKDLKRSHDHLSVLISKRAAKVHIQRNREFAIMATLRNKEAGEKYAMQKGKFFGLEIKYKNICIVPLKSIDEFVLEGKKHSHCVFGARYYEREDSLCLKAIVGNESVETIEYDLKQNKVVQSRGKFNQPSVFHGQILEAFEVNGHLIKKIALQ